MILRPLHFLVLCVLWLMPEPHVKGQRMDSTLFKQVLSTSAFGSAHVSELLQDKDGFLWIGTHGGLYRFDGDIIKAYLHDPSSPTSLSSNYIIEMVADTHGGLWIGTQGGGLNYLEHGTDTFTHFSFQFEGNPNHVNSIWGILPDDPFLWLATRDGLIRFHPQTKEAIRLRVEEHPVTPDKKRRNMLRQLRHDPDGKDRIWFSTLSGLYTLDKRSLLITPHGSASLKVLFPLHDESDGQYMYAHFLKVNEGWLLGAYGGGHYFYEEERKIWDRLFFQEKDPALPLSDNVVLQYQKLSDTTVFFTGSRSGILDLVHHSCLLTPVPGDPSGPGTWYSEGVCTDRQGHVWLGNSRGLFRTFKPLTTGNEYPGFQIYPARLMVDHIERQAILEGDPIQIALLPHHTTLSIRPGLIAPELTGKVQFRYRRQKEQEEWTLMERGSSIYLDGWNPGQFSFLVEAVDPETGVSFAQQEIGFLAKAYLWKRWWFIPLLVSAVLAVLALFARMRFAYSRRQLALKHGYEKQLLDMQQAALQGQLNPHFMFNALNAIKQYMIDKQPREATRFLNAYAGLMRDVLDHSRKNIITLSEEFKFIEVFLEIEQLRLGGRFRYVISIAPEIQPDDYVIPPLMIQPLVENAIWHGLMYKKGQGEIIIAATLDPNGIMITVQDNGIGRQAHRTIREQFQTRKSTGLQLVSERLQLYSRATGKPASMVVRDLLDQDGIGCGTKVEIQLPIRLYHESTQGISVG